MKKFEIKKCKICGYRLSMYNKEDECFHHNRFKESIFKKENLNYNGADYHHKMTDWYYTGIWED